MPINCVEGRDASSGEVVLCTQSAVQNRCGGPWYDESEPSSVRCHCVSNTHLYYLKIPRTRTAKHIHTINKYMYVYLTLISVLWLTILPESKYL